ncbi:uncharacterized protein EAF02_006929 [Botrytis sinoallii]|uniref:uncharacterized protein n=1 Tax=Botrytis sinoallii TaxID=1463999 RepID=UPI0019005467|nr:uncharacterized protein EAF02_006929 [Botrytis sinoallii]KAF7881038.1 hypothetical protein EAF02_006929 [Botrytis sinoallii]
MPFHLVRNDSPSTSFGILFKLGMLHAKLDCLNHHDFNTQPYHEHSDRAIAVAPLSLLTAKNQVIDIGKKAKNKLSENESLSNILDRILSSST